VPRGKPAKGKLSERAKAIIARTREWIKKRDKFIKGVKL
jgi:hypothetical protein